MISRNEFDAYNLAVEQIGNKAASDVESSVLNWCAQNPTASVAEKREAAKLIMEGYVQGYDDIASEFAAEWYDHRAKSEGISLDQAITMAVYSPEKSDAVARYQARKLAKGGDAAFAKACGEYARNDALRSLNETIIANVGRDKAKGVRFARVTTGRETCTFCLMLASRGAVYHTRRTAGEFKSFHRGCDCKVVPGFEDNPDAELVEGIKPGEMRDQWWRFEKIDATEGLSSAERNRLKRLVLDGGELPEEVKKTNPTARMRKAGRAGSGWISAGYRLDAEVKANGFRDVSGFYRYLESRRTAADIVEAGILGEKILANADATPKFYELVKGHLHKSVKLADGVSPKELRVLYRQFKEIDETKGLNEAERAAAKRQLLGIPGPEVVYRKPVSFFAKERGGKRDLEAHNALRAAGHAVVVREETAPKGFSNIDLLLDGRLCELKSPTSDASGVNGLRFIESNIRKAIKQFSKTEKGVVRPIQVALNLIDVPVARSSAVRRATIEMDRHNVDRVLIITNGWIIDDLRKNKP